MAKKKIVKEEAEHAAEEAVQSIEEAAEESVSAAAPKKKKDPMYDLIEVDIPVRIKLAGEDLAPGRHTIERHQLDTIREMTDRKIKADISVFTGKNYLVEKIAGAISTREIKQS